MCKYRKEKERWGEFVDVKINIPEALEEQVKHSKPGMVMVSSVTDPYQLLEKKYKITRRCLEILVKNNFKVGLLTKSSLITRDIDIIKKFGPSVCPGFTISCFDENDAKNFEPGASPVKSRLISLKKFKDAGISTSVFIGPFIPKISEKNIEKFLKYFKDVGVKIIFFDRLNIKSGNWPEIKKVLESCYPNLAKDYYKRWLTDEYYKKIKIKIIKICKKYKLPLRVLFR